MRNRNDRDRSRTLGLPTPSPARKRPRFRPNLDALEGRLVLSTLSVTNNHDSGSGSLRYELAQASSGTTISFAKSLDGHTITLTSGPLAIAGNVAINGPGASELTVSGGGAQGDFTVASGVTASLSGLTIAGGKAATGGGIDNSGTLTVTNCTISDDDAYGAVGAGYAGGGGITNESGASIAITGDTFTGDIATGSSGFDASGGAFIDFGSATVTNSTFTGNPAPTMATQPSAATAGRSRTSTRP